MNTIEICDKYVAPTYKRANLAIARGEGSMLYDEAGNSYIDLGSGIAVNTFGVSDPVWQEAVCEQARKIQHASNLYYTAPQAELARMLCMRTGLSSVFFGNSGAEANECAIKAARKYSHDKYGDGRHMIVTLKNSFHGRTITTLSATGQDVFHKDFTPFTEGFIYAEPNDIDNLREIFDNYPCCAFMAELIQGESGVTNLDSDYVKAAYALCAERDILFIADEVQTGNGRTGKLYAYMHFDILPDIVTTAKGLAGGLPLGATMFGTKCRATLGAGAHGSTFGGNPICAAAALSTLSRIDDELLSGVTERSNIIKQELLGAPGIKSISGLGLMLGIECVRPAADIVKDCLEKGVVVLTAHEKVRLLPALNIPIDTLIKATKIIKEVVNI